MHGRWVERHPGDIAVKCGRHICLDESSALQLAREAGVPTPRMHKAERTADGVCRIHMDFVPGQTLDKVWPELSLEQKADVVRQLREILTAMRAQKPPAQTLIGTCSGGEVHDLRVYSHYTAGPFEDEEAFNKGTVLDLLPGTPMVLREAFARRLRTDHRLTFIHADIAQHNIMIHGGRITALLDWEYAGWFPEYWEYVKFFERPCQH
ncbi:MAG: hypothetical protein M4579_007657, partial [Chaenotheca gracillima]